MVYNNFCGPGMMGYGGGWLGWSFPVMFIILIGIIIWLLLRNKSSCCGHSHEEPEHQHQHPESPKKRKH